MSANNTSQAEKKGPKAGSTRTFLIIWFGQLISTLGSGLTSFALGVYIYQRTGSATQLGLAVLAATLPGILFSTIAGVVVDRFDRRWIMLIGDTGSALCTLAIWLLLGTGQLQVWHIYVANALNTSFNAFQSPAYLAATTLLVPKQHYGRAAGMGQLSNAISQIVTPLIAGLLVVAIGMQGVILIDFATYLFAVLTLMLVRIPKPEQTREGKAAKGSFWQETGYGWKYLKARSGLMGMLILFAFINFALGFYSVLFTPLVLSFAGADVLGSVISVGGLGLLAGSLLMSTWGGTPRKIISLMVSMFAFGLLMSLTGLLPNPYLIGASGFFFLLLLPVAQGSSQAIWQAKVAPDIQGRIFAIRGLIARLITPIALLLAGPLADRVFEPWMAVNGPLAGTFGQVMGTGTGRGIGLIFVVMGLFISIAVVVGTLNPHIRRVEIELPDVI